MRIGWWEDVGASGRAWVGDDPLDASADYVQAVAAAYRNQFKRGPTVQELLRLLELTLLVYGQELLSGLRGKEVVAMTPRMRPKPKSRKYKVGDYFAVPLGNRRFGYGRIVWTSDRMGPLAEFYDLVTSDLAPVSEARRSPRPLFHTYFEDAKLKQGKWPVIGSAPLSLTADQLPRFVMAHPLDENKGKLVIGDRPVRDATTEELQQLPRYSIVSAALCEDELKGRLGGRGSPRRGALRRE